MRIAIAGGHGKIGQLLARQLVESGARPVSIIRNPDHASEIEELGAVPLVHDLESTTADDLAAALDGVDAVVFAAGAGPDSGPERKLTVDRDGAILLADAAVAAGIRRMVVISAMKVDEFDPDSDDVYQIYMKAKSDADAAVRERDLDWTIVRPGGLTDDEPTGMVQVGESLEKGTIARGDVAAVVAMLVLEGRGVGAQFELTSGTHSVADLPL